MVVNMYPYIFVYESHGIQKGVKASWSVLPLGNFPFDHEHVHSPDRVDSTRFSVPRSICMNMAASARGVQEGFRNN